MVRISATGWFGSISRTAAAAAVESAMGSPAARSRSVICANGICAYGR
jgi:hypothetical protein